MIASIKKPAIQSHAISQDKFLLLLPLIRRQAWSAFSNAGRELREELVAEVIANAFSAFSRLVERGRVDFAYATPLAKYAIRQVREGRRVGGTRSGRDILSISGLSRYRLKREPMHRWNRAKGVWNELLIEDKTAGPAETAAVRIDFATWLCRLPVSARHVAMVLANGESGRDAAKRFGLSPARISQLRSELKASWESFQAGAAS